MYKHESFADEPNADGKENSRKFQDLIHIYTLDQPEVIDKIIEWRTFMDRYSERKNTLPRFLFIYLFIFNQKQSYIVRTLPT